jgi:vacuolar-type H+-ATPase subunit I/STV1
MSTLKTDMEQQIRNSKVPLTRQEVYDKVNNRSSYAYSTLRELIHDGSVVQINKKFVHKTRTLINNKPEELDYKFSDNVLINAVRGNCSKEVANNILKVIKIEVEAFYLIFCLANDIPIPVGEKLNDFEQAKAQSRLDTLIKTINHE